jgi:hypothetical protein
MVFPLLAVPRMARRGFMSAGPAITGEGPPGFVGDKRAGHVIVGVEWTQSAGGHGADLGRWDRFAVEITSRGGNAVLISAEELAALEETAYLLRVPANAKRLLLQLPWPGPAGGRIRELAARATQWIEIV